METPLIQYGTPTSLAWQRMKTILFNPFDLGKWFVLGFSAWLATLLEGAGSSGSGSYGDTDSDREGIDEWISEVSTWVSDHIELVVGVGSVLALIGLAVFVALLWVSARGKFMFLDNVIHNRAMVAEPWTEFRSAGNSLFVWMLCFTIACVFLFGLLIAAMTILIVGAVSAEGAGWTGASVAAAVCVGGLILALSIALAYVMTLLEDFVIPMMYRNKVAVTEGWSRVLGVHREYTGKFVLYFLWKALIQIGVGVVIIAFVLGTCCLGGILLAIPYLGTVLALPIYVFFRCLGPEFLRQFGDEYSLLTEGPVAGLEGSE
tara:strand:- start:1226 stop:2179 length:954 start_codon:yes stop_codon:yes gene_type:complete